MPAEAATLYTTNFGQALQGLAEDVLGDEAIRRSLRGKVQLIFTSPPFPLNTKKRYGNLNGQEYIDWLSGFATTFRDLLTPDGSIVMELGNAWEPGRPVMSTLALRALLAFQDAGDLQLCQQFICSNPARLPSPAQWVTIERIRLKDSYTHVWWLSPTDRPKADNRQVLTPYGKRMRRLLVSGEYNSGKRPSEHLIGTDSFLHDNGGAIPASVLTFPNTSSADAYLRYCRKEGLTPHPARMPIQLAEFFIRLTTAPGDLVLDPFAGSNTTGQAAESLKRAWVAVEPSAEYLRGSLGRFETVTLHDKGRTAATA